MGGGGQKYDSVNSKDVACCNILEHLRRIWLITARLSFPLFEKLHPSTLILDLTFTWHVALTRKWIMNQKFARIANSALCAQLATKAQAGTRNNQFGNNLSVLDE